MAFIQPLMVYTKGKAMRPGKRERTALREIKRQLGEAQSRAALVPDTPGRARSAWDRKQPITRKVNTCGWSTRNAQSHNAKRAGGIAARD